MSDETLGERSRSRGLAEASTPPATLGERSRSRGLAEASTPPAAQRGRAWLWYGGASLFLTPLAAYSPQAGSRLLNVALSLCAVVVSYIGIRRHQSRAWWLLWGGLTSVFVGNALWAIQDLLALPLPPSTLLIDGWYLVALALGVAGLFKLAGGGSGQRRWEPILDTIIVTIGIAAPTWSFLIAPTIDAGAVSSGELAVRLIYPAGDVVILAMTARLWFRASDRTPTTALLVLAQGAMLVADCISWSTSAASSTPAFHPIVGGLYLSWFTLCAASSLHPSMARMGAAAGDPPRRGGARRLAFLLALSLFAPVSSTMAHLAQGRGPQNALDALAPSVLTVFLVSALVIRMHLVARLAQRHAEKLRRQAIELSDALGEQHALKTQLSHRAMHDPLTGLGNRALLTDRLESALSGTAAGTGHRPALLLLDLDGFKDVNDTYGHPVGDELLVQVARRLLGVLTDADTLARLGGDEFAILLPDATPAKALAVAHNALDALRVPYRSGQRDLYLTTSVGLLATTAAMDTAEALRDADLALYAAKGAGKNQVVAFEPRLRTARMDHTRLTTGLRRAIANREFALQYQPVIDLATGEMYAVEALLRWNPPGEKTVPPDRFIPAAEETGLIVPIGAWVLETACADAKRWYRERGIVITVNVSGRQLRDRTFADTVKSALTRNGLPGAALVLEITETVLVTATTADAETVVGQLQALRAEGVRVAIDDFGTGYSSLSYLRHLPVDVLKIDRSFTLSDGASEPNPTDWAFTKAILELSSSLELQTVAEGVETPEQARLLRRMKCPFAQGYHFSRPVAAAAIDDLLREADPLALATRAA